MPRRFQIAVAIRDFRYYGSITTVANFVEAKETAQGQIDIKLIAENFSATRAALEVNAETASGCDLTFGVTVRSLSAVGIHPTDGQPPLYPRCCLPGSGVEFWE
jgi:hypothetical protein